MNRESPRAPTDPTEPDFLPEDTVHDRTHETSVRSPREYGSRDPRGPVIEPVSTDDTDGDFETEEPTQVMEKPEGFLDANDIVDRPSPDAIVAGGRVLDRDRLPRRSGEGERPGEKPPGYADFLRDALDRYIEADVQGPQAWEAAVDQALRDAVDLDDLPETDAERLRKRLLEARPEA